MANNSNFKPLQVHSEVHDKVNVFKATFTKLDGSKYKGHTQIVEDGMRAIAQLKEMGLEIKDK